MLANLLIDFHIYQNIIDPYNMMKEIYLIRHGQTEWNKLGLGQGSEADIPLNDTGRDEALRTGIYLHKKRSSRNPFDLIICSPLSRAVETAEIIAKHIDYKQPIIKLDYLTEVGQGKLSGKSIKMILNDPFYEDFLRIMNDYSAMDKLEQVEIEDKEYPQIFVDKYLMESPTAVYNRIDQLIQFISDTKYNKILIITHNGTIDHFNKKILNSAYSIKGDLSGGTNCHMTYYRITSNGYRLMIPPSTFHLKHP